MINKNLFSTWKCDRNPTNIVEVSVIHPNPFVKIIPLLCSQPKMLVSSKFGYFFHILKDLVRKIGLNSWLHYQALLQCVFHTESRCSGSQRYWRSNSSVWYPITNYYQIYNQKIILFLRHYKFIQWIWNRQSDSLRLSFLCYIHTASEKQPRNRRYYFMFKMSYGDEEADGKKHNVPLFRLGVCPFYIT
jgi:hypothetical protein